MEMLSTEKRYREKLSVVKRSLPCGTGLISSSRYSVRECSYSISRKGNWNSHWHEDQQRNVDRFFLQACFLAELEVRLKGGVFPCTDPTPSPLWTPEMSDKPLYPWSFLSTANPHATCLTAWAGLSSQHWAVGKGQGTQHQSRSGGVLSSPRCVPIIFLCHGFGFDPKPVFH